MSKRDKGIGFPYFVVENNKQRSMEFRPKCYYGSTKVLPEVIAQLNQLGTATSECHMWNEKQSKICWIKTNDLKDKKSRWQIYVEPLNLSQGAALDFIFDTADENLKNDVESILETIEFNPAFKSSHSCLRRSDWL